MRRLAVSFLAVLLIAAVPAFAQEEPPARVGRVSFVEGQLGFHLAGETAWSAAKPNYPVATGGSFWTDPKSRAELRIGSRTIGLSGNTELDVTKLNEQVMQVALPQGRVDLRVRSLLEGESIEIDLPRGAVWILQPGTYDIDAGAEGQSERIAVFEGSARFVGGALDVAIKAGDAAVISGTQTLAAATEKASPDEFAKWCRSRDYDERKLAAPYRVSPQMTGYEELDEYGSWRAVPQYGEVWFPRRVASDWAPYRDGHWVWVEPWGWNWVDDEPWGFAPFHYGRWARVEDQWAWVPGDFVPQPVYAPALVAFVGDPGTGYWDAADVGPAVGWFPLGPGEIYWPSYTRNRNYIRNVNIANVGRSVIDPIANAAASRGNADPPPQVRDQRFTNRNATTVVPARIFANAAPVAPAARQMPRPVVQQAVQQAPVSVRPPQLAPASARAQATPRAGGAAARGAVQGPTGPAPAASGVAHAPTPNFSTSGAPGAHAPPTAAEIHGPHAPTPPDAAHLAPAHLAPASPGPGVAQAPSGRGAANAAGEAGTGPQQAPGTAHAPPAPPAATPQSAHAPMRGGPMQAGREPPPPATHGPMRIGPPPQAAHAPPPSRTAPPAMREAPHAGPPPQAAHAAPPMMREPPRMPPPQAVHVAPPPAPAPHPAPPPPQIVHAAPPAPAPQVFRGPPPAPRPAPAPPPQIAHAPPAPPPAAARPAAPPAPPPGKGRPPGKGGPPGHEEKH